MGGFTLIELLVVTGIIAILITILIPSLSIAKAQSRMVLCQSNIRQIGMAMNLYCEDYNQDLPLAKHGYKLKETWMHTLRPYLNSAQYDLYNSNDSKMTPFDRVRICPDDPNKDVRLKNNVSSYMLNEYTATVNPDQGTINNRRGLPRPAETYLMFSLGDARGASNDNDHTHSTSWLDVPSAAWASALQDIQPDRHARSKVSDHGKGPDNYLFADFHVETVDASKLKALLDSGVNFAKPPM